MASEGSLARKLFRLKTKRQRLDRQISQLTAKLKRKHVPGTPRPRWGNCSVAK